ncbi:MAG TPA: HAD-IIIC family phosphatase [Verrucomicrobiae bacterium]|jgi:FkbH-like protein|nr:HAD-IIIC family phosphatase [Verrucomicrobiae bacterium]
MNSENKSLNLRADVDRLIANGAVQLASGCMAELWREEAGLSVAPFLVSRFEQLRGKVTLTPYRLAVLRSFTLEPAIPLVRAEAFVKGIDLSAQLGDFNAYAQDILDADSSLYRFSPDAVILAARTPELAPDLWNQFADLSPDAVSAAIQRVVNSFAQWIRIFRERSSAALILHSLELQPHPHNGILDAQRENGQAAAIHQINRELRRIAGEHRSVYILDYDGLMARHGRLRWNDQRKWLLARMPIAADNLLHLSREWLRFLVPLSGKTAKVAIVDLDNTLWCGIIGEDGMNGIKLGPEYPGAAYQNLQRALLDLTRRGILLAICSKNNPEDAMEALTHHPGMVLKPKDFAAMRINWGDKAQNLREIANELNLGTDSLAFIDDNPFEREQIRKVLPEVTIIDLPANPMEYASALRDCPVFERLALSSEDKQRTVMYAEQQERAQVEHTFENKEDFFRYLEQEAEVAPVSSATLARVAQLTQKTNQFNLTTRRYTEQQIQEMSGRSGWQVLSISVRDRFGDHGLVGVAIAHDQGESCEIDTFLLSCRVIGRTVESALLSQLAEHASSKGCKRLLGWFFPTKKNAPARDFYPQHGFELTEQSPEGSLWSFDLTKQQIAAPKWVRVTKPAAV